MKVIMCAVALIAAVACATAVHAQPQQTSDAHAEHAAGPAVPVLADRWIPDAPLREGMRRARAAVAVLARYEKGQPDVHGVVAQATAVESAVTYMFANCRLAPEPDAALHSILVPLLTAAEGLKTNPKHVGAIAEMRATIARYPLYFEDPDWDTPPPSGG